MSEAQTGKLLALAAGGLVFGVATFLVGLSMGASDDASIATPRAQAAPGETATRDATRTAAPVALAGTADEDDRDESSGQHSEADRRWMLEALEKEKARRIAAAILPDDTGGTVLRKILEHDADLEPLFDDFESFSRHLRVSAPDELVIDVTPETVNAIFQDYARRSASRVTFQLAPGRYDVTTALRLKDAELVTLRGAGKDETLISASVELVFAEGIDNLRVEDLTLDGRQRSNSLLDSRGLGALLVSRSRFLGFDAGAGHSAAIGVSSESYVGIEDCEFLGGYGRSPLSGSAVSVRAPSFVYCRGCVFRELQGWIIAIPAGIDGSRIKAENCSSYFDQTTGRHAGPLTVELSGCTFDRYGRDDLAKQVKDLGGNVYREMAKGSQPGLESVLDRLALDGVIAARVESHLVREPLYVLVTTKSGTQRYFNDPDRGPELRTSKPSASPGLRTPAISCGQALAVAATIELHGPGSGLGKRPTAIVLEEQAGENGGTRLVWKIEHGAGLRWTVIDADTGAHLDA